MNSVPDAFLDSVCCQLNRTDLHRLKDTCTLWSVKATIHDSKRRELQVSLNVNYEQTEVGIWIEGLETISTINPRYDKIGHIEVGFLSIDVLHEKTSLECFKKKVIPVLRSLAFDCALQFASSNSFLSDLSESIFSGLHGCNQLTVIYTENYACNCPEFIKHQISLGRLKMLILNGDWPADLQAALRLFVRSPNFALLDLRRSNLTIDIYMVIAFVERFLRGDFSRVTELQGRPSFPLTWLEELHHDKQQLHYRTQWDMFVQWVRPSGGRLTAKHISDSHICLCSY
uniref:F-box domain-containing protein n=1 Tax=Steinernema glaseri TaxID=37863 RepID=A0A1I7Y5F5_9BILA